jgi:hypothetical protein
MKDIFSIDNLVTTLEIPLTPFAWAYGKIKEIDFSTMFTIEDIIDVAKIPLKPFTYLSNNLPTSLDYSKFFSIETVTKTFKAALKPFTWIYNKASAKDFSEYISLEDLSGVGKTVLKPFTYIGGLVTKTNFSEYLSLQPLKDVGKTLLKPFEYIGTEINKVDWAGLFSFDPSKIFPNLSNDISGDIAEWFGNIDLPAFEPSKWTKQIQALGTTAFDFLTDLVKGIRIDAVSSVFTQATGGLAGTGKDIPLSGLVKGPGTGTSDSIPVRLSNGEYVIPAKQTAEYAEVLNQIRAGTFGKGLPKGVTLGEYAAGIKKGTYSTKDNKGFFDALGNLKTYDAAGKPTGHYWMPQYAPIMDKKGSDLTGGLFPRDQINYNGKNYLVSEFNKLVLKGVNAAGRVVKEGTGKYSYDNTGLKKDANILQQMPDVTTTRTLESITGKDLTKLPKLDGFTVQGYDFNNFPGYMGFLESWPADLVNKASKRNLQIKEIIDAKKPLAKVGNKEIFDPAAIGMVRFGGTYADGNKQLIDDSGSWGTSKYEITTPFGTSSLYKLDDKGKVTNLLLPAAQSDVQQGAPNAIKDEITKTVFETPIKIDTKTPGIPTLKQLSDSNLAYNGYPVDLKTLASVMGTSQKQGHWYEDIPNKILNFVEDSIIGAKNTASAISGVLLPGGYGMEFENMLPNFTKDVGGNIIESGMNFVTNNGATALMPPAIKYEAVKTATGNLVNSFVTGGTNPATTLGLGVDIKKSLGNLKFEPNMPTEKYGKEDLPLDKAFGTPLDVSQRMPDDTVVLDAMVITSGGAKEDDRSFFDTLYDAIVNQYDKAKNTLAQFPEFVNSAIDFIFGKAEANTAVPNIVPKILPTISDALKNASGVGTAGVQLPAAYDFYGQYLSKNNPSAAKMPVMTGLTGIWESMGGSKVNDFVDSYSMDVWKNFNTTFEMGKDYRESQYVGADGIIHGGGVPVIDNSTYTGLRQPKTSLFDNLFGWTSLYDNKAPVVDSLQDDIYAWSKLHPNAWSPSDIPKGKTWSIMDGVSFGNIPDTGGMTGLLINTALDANFNPVAGKYIPMNGDFTYSESGAKIPTKPDTSGYQQGLAIDASGNLSGGGGWEDIAALGETIGNIFSGIGDFFSSKDRRSVDKYIPSLGSSYAALNMMYKSSQKDAIYGWKAMGGLVTGPGTGTSDSIPTMLSNGEFVINAAATAKNRALVEAINSGATISSAASPIMSIPTAAKSADGANSVTNNSVINMNITGDISRQTRAEISQMLPQIAAGVNQYNRERNYRG